MADYINIKGSTIQYLDSDPSNPVVGQVWYNSTTEEWTVPETLTKTFDVS
jgi:hypothetical protein